MLLLIGLCDETQAIDNATIVIQHNSAYSSYTRKIICDKGYLPDGNTEQYCHFGEWTPYFNECTGVLSGIVSVGTQITLHNVLDLQKFVISLRLKMEMSKSCCMNLFRLFKWDAMKAITWSHHSTL